MIVTLLTHGIPNNHSEQASCDPYLFAKFFEKKGIKVNLVCIWEEQLNTSNKNKKFQIQDLKKKFKNILKIKILEIKKKTFFEKLLRFFLRILSNSPHYFYGSKEIKFKTIDELKKMNQDLIINFFELPASILSQSTKLNFFYVNYLGAYRKKTEFYRLNVLIKDGIIKNLFLILNCIIYIWKIDKVYKRMLLNSKLNFCPGYDTLVDLKKIKIKNLYYSKPLSKNLHKIKKKKNVFPNVLLIGNLKSTFMRDNLNEMANNLIEGLKEIRKKQIFYIRIVGKFKPLKYIKRKLNYKWIKFTGWVENSDLEYKNADYIFVPNSFSLSPRTKIIEAMSCGTVVLTYYENIKGIFQKMKNKKNILISKNPKHFIKLFQEVLNNKELFIKIRKEGAKTYKRFYDPKKILEKNFYKLKSIYEKN